MTSWNRGYYSDSIYTCGYYREMAPTWLDLVALIQGHIPPREKEGDSFNYLELGCGMGFGLCLLAASYPEANFLGVDFNPSHIAHATKLAFRLGLSNIHFLEADFLELKANPSALFINLKSNEGFQYVAAHGIISWVVDAVRDSLLSIASACLQPGGIFYCSYNTFPGWLSRTAFQKLYWLERGRSEKNSIKEPFQRTLDSLNTLLGTESTPTPLGSNYPLLRNDLGWIDLNQPDYLCGEYANEGWAPNYVSDIHQSCLDHKLTFLGSGTLPDCFEQLLAPSLQETIFKESNPFIRQTLIDLATNKSFRRDLFVKGFNRLTRSEADYLFSRLLITPLEQMPTGSQASGDTQAEAESPFAFNTSFGQVLGDPEIYGPVAAEINSGPCTIEHLQAKTGYPIIDLQLILALFLDCSWIAISRRDLAKSTFPVGQRCNKEIIELLYSGRPYYYIILPGIGLGTQFSLIDSLIYRAYNEGLEGDIHSACVLMGLEGLGVHLLDSEKQPINDPTIKLQRISSFTNAFLSQRLPMLVRLGAFPQKHPNQKAKR